MEQVAPGRARIEHPFLGALQLSAEPAADGSTPELLFCENETNTQRLFGTPSEHAMAKGRHQRSRRRRARATVNPGAPRHEMRVLVSTDRGAGRHGRAARCGCGRERRRVDPTGVSFDQIMTQREAKPTSSTPSSPRRPRQRMKHW